ncbi:GNAT family N-acetyltransferase [Archangium sp.]|jgi:ribosomal protein S18 acetylase RimI-like enzyme|uniref:GNAT family N-acetyltransferase n=1 Tax=Archangium sp. TaxID=1872627 RepID=UPI002ED8964B
MGRHVEVRALGPGDEAALERLLAAHPHSSLFLMSNSRASGLRDGDLPYQGAYVGAFEEGMLRGVGALYWSGILVLQAPEHLDLVVEELARRAARPLRGFSGPWSQCERARRVLGLEGAACTLEGKEVLFVLELARLRIPPALASGEVHSRRARDEESDLLAHWRHDYLVEIMGKRPGEPLMAEAREFVSRTMREGSLFVLTHGPSVVALSAFNARLPEVVQVGGVYTPPALRGRGHARAVVAGSLRMALAEGARSSVLYTPIDNLPAQRAYRALGFEEVGDYGVILLEQEHRFTASPGVSTSRQHG